MVGKFRAEALNIGRVGNADAAVAVRVHHAETGFGDLVRVVGKPAVLLPFLPEVEETIRKNYEHYEMQDAWENLKGRYFNHKAEYANLATEIKSTFNRTIANFSRYFDDLYTNTYYKMMLSRGKQDGKDA